MKQLEELEEAINNIYHHHTIEIKTNIEREHNWNGKITNEQTLESTKKIKIKILIYIYIYR